MQSENNELYEFGPFRLDLGEHKIERTDGFEQGSLPETTFRILCILVQNSGHLLTKAELMDRVWPDSFVEENNLDKRIHAIRHFLAEKRGGQKYIETVRMHGYRFVADVRRIDGQPSMAENPATSVGSRPLAFSHPQLAEGTSASLGSVVSLAEWRDEKPDKEPSAKKLSETPIKPDEPAYDRAFILLKGSESHGRRAFVIAGVMVLLGFSVVGFGLFRYLGGAQPDLNLTGVKRLTLNGNSLYPSISPDGKFIAYVLRESAHRLSIHLMNVETGDTKQIFAPAGYRDIGSLAFSRDGNYIYFAQSETFGAGPVYGLYRMALLGGVPTRLITDFRSYALSRDGTRLAFVRNSRAAGESLLMIANADGTGEYTVAANLLADAFYFPAWSPDGGKIVCSVGSTEVSGERMRLLEVDLADGKTREITQQRWNFLGAVFWLSDGSGLLASGRDTTGMAMAWHISYPDGEVRELPNSVGRSYWISSQTDDSGTMAAQSSELETNIWIATSGDEPDGPVWQARQITHGNDGHHVSHMPDGRLVFTSANSRMLADIWIMNADGSNRQQLTADMGTNTMPTASRDGRYIVFDSDRAGKINIWRMDADGSNPMQLTFGGNEKAPAVSPDGKWVFYTSGDEPSLWRVPIDGGGQHRLTGANWRGAVISPDGKWILSTFREPNQNAQRKFAMLDSVTGEVVRIFDLPGGVETNGHGGHWAPDGRAFVYTAAREGIWNVWKQPIDGGQPAQLTDLRSTDEVYSPSFSADGKHLAFSRGGWRFDVYLLRNAKK